MERRIFVCDICGAEQAKTNHWFYVIIDGSQFISGPLGNQGQPRGGAELLHLCGEACALKRYSEFLGGMK